MDIKDRANRLLSNIAAPPGSLGLLEKQIKKVFICWNELHKEINPCHLIFAADNGIVEEGVVRQMQEITYIQAKNMEAGRAAVSCFCRCNNISYKVADVGINSIKAVGCDYKVAKGTKNFLKEPAMSRAEYNKAFHAGVDMVRRAQSEGCNLISIGEMGIGNTTTSSAVLYALTHVAPEFIVGYGANKVHPEVIERKREVITQAVELYKDKMKTPADMIRYIGGFDIAAMCGAMIECSRSNTPFVLDGFITAVAFACASVMYPEAAGYGIASHMSREPGMLYALKLGGIKEEEVPIRADLALGEGTGAVLFVNMLRTMMYTVWNIAKMSEVEDCLPKVDVDIKEA